MLIEDRHFSEENTERTDWHDSAVYLYCSFTDVAMDGRDLDGAMIWCTLEGLDWYWGLINTAVLAHVTFERCTFRGTSFAGCQIVQCKFVECRFLNDNVGGTCSFADSVFTECEFARCEVALDGPGQRPIFEGTRWYGCTQDQCIGLEGQF